MGNRAVLAFDGTPPNGECLYLHWNGGRSSVDAFLEAARRLGIRSADFRWGAIDRNAAIRQLGELIARFFFGVELNQQTVYVERYDTADKDNGDNGLYILNEHFEIVERRFRRLPEEHDSHKKGMVIDRLLTTAPHFND